MMRHSTALRVISEAQPSPPCSCKECQGMCIRPCWPTPAEAAALMDAGFGERLMWDHRQELPGVPVLAPAVAGSEGCSSPWPPMGGCTFQEGGLCILHDRGLKPLEGRVAHHDGAISPDKKMRRLNLAIARAWDTEEGRAVLERWMAENGYPKPALMPHESMLAWARRLTAEAKRGH